MRLVLVRQPEQVVKHREYQGGCLFCRAGFALLVEFRSGIDDGRKVRSHQRTEFEQQYLQLLYGGNTGCFPRGDRYDADRFVLPLFVVEVDNVFQRGGVACVVNRRDDDQSVGIVETVGEVDQHVRRALLHGQSFVEKREIVGFQVEQLGVGECVLSEVVFQVERNPVAEPSGANAGGKDGDSFHVSGGFAGMPVVVSERTPAGLF